MNTPNKNIAEKWLQPFPVFSSYKLGMYYMTSEKKIKKKNKH